jgi:metal-responsive CopG/Arc/MetJ family transcriptional regulator
MSSVTFATKADEDSDLVKEFNEYKQENSMNSKSEAIRSLMRAGLEEEYNQDESDDIDHSLRHHCRTR